MDIIRTKCKICGGRGYVFVNHGEEVLKDICDSCGREEYVFSDKDGELSYYIGTEREAIAHGVENNLLFEECRHYVPNL